MPNNPVHVLINPLLGSIGRKAINSVLYIVDLTVFIHQAVRDAYRNQHTGQHQFRPLITQIIFSGIDTLPLLSVLALATGIIFTGQFIHLTSDFTAEADIIGTLAILMTFEVAPLLTAFILVARSGSAMTVDLGNMSLHGETEGLELLGININDFLISNRLLATAISQLVLATYFSGIALYGGVAFASMLYSSTYLLYLEKILTAQTPVLLLLFIFKNLVFGLVIAGAACFHALHVHKSATEVPQQTQRAIVNSLAIIAIFDGLLAIAAQ